MKIIDAIQLAIDDHRAYAKKLEDHEFTDALKLAIDIIKSALEEEKEETE